MRQPPELRFRVILTLFLSYLLPLLVIGASTDPGWARWTLGLLFLMLSSAGLYLVLGAWEAALSQNRNTIVVPEPVSPPSEDAFFDSKPLQEHIQNLEKQCTELSEQLQTDLKNIKQLQNEKNELTHRCQDLEQSLKSHQQVAEEQLHSKTTLLEEYQQTIADQRQVIEKKQKLISSLESKANDLKYELKTLLDLTDRIEIDLDEPSLAQESSKPAKSLGAPAPKRNGKALVTEHPSLPGLLADPRPQTPVDAIQQLKRCIDIAQKLTGARHLAGDSSRFRDLSVDGYALDLRRLCDSLRSETSGMILLYSQKEDRLLFVNNQVRDVLGWSPEKFVQNFPALSVDGLTEWKRGLLRLSGTPQVGFPLTLKTRNGEEKTVHCQLGSIPTGIFKTHIVGVMY